MPDESGTSEEKVKADFREVPEISVTGEEKPKREVSIISTRKAAFDVQKMKQNLDNRLMEKQKQDEERKAAMEKKATLPQTPEGEITAGEANALFGGDLSGLKIDEATKNFTPVTPQAVERVQRRRRLAREYESAIEQFAGISRTAANAPLLDNITRLLEDRRRMLEDLI